MTPARRMCAAPVENVYARSGRNSRCVVAQNVGWPRSTQRSQQRVLGSSRAQTLSRRTGEIQKPGAGKRLRETDSMSGLIM